MPLYPAEHFDVSATLLLGALAGAHHAHEDDAVGRIRRLARRIFRGAVGPANGAESSSLRASLEPAPQARPQGGGGGSGLSSLSRGKQSRQTPTSTPPSKEGGASDSTSPPLGSLEA